jgi:hypothetical protein
MAAAGGKRRALVSVSDKAELITLAKARRPRAAIGF